MVACWYIDWMDHRCKTRQICILSKVTSLTIHSDIVESYHDFSLLNIFFLVLFIPGVFTLERWKVEGTRVKKQWSSINSATVMQNYPKILPILHKVEHTSYNTSQITQQISHILQKNKTYQDINGQVADFLHLQNGSENDMRTAAHRANVKHSRSQHQRTLSVIWRSSDISYQK